MRRSCWSGSLISSLPSQVQQAACRNSRQVPRSLLLSFNFPLTVCAAAVPREVSSKLSLLKSRAVQQEFSTGSSQCPSLRQFPSSSVCRTCSSGSLLASSPFPSPTSCQQGFSTGSSHSPSPLQFLPSVSLCAQCPVQPVWLDFSEVGIWCDYVSIAH